MHSKNGVSDEYIYADEQKLKNVMNGFNSKRKENFFLD